MTQPSTFIHFNVALDDDEMGMEVDQVVVAAEEVTDEPEAGPSSDVLPDYSAAKTGLTCLPQRAALLKSMLNFLKKAIQVNNFSKQKNVSLSNRTCSFLPHQCKFRPSRMYSVKLFIVRCIQTFSLSREIIRVVSHFANNY